MKLLALLMMTSVMSFSASSLLANDSCGSNKGLEAPSSEAGTDQKAPTPVDNKDQRGG